MTFKIRIFFKQPSSISHIDVEHPTDVQPRILGALAKADGALFNEVMFIPYENILCITKVVDGELQGLTIGEALRMQ